MRGTVLPNGNLLLTADNMVRRGLADAYVTELQYHRPPTKGEIKFGYGATHYRTFPVEECCHKGTRVMKTWFRADDGLRYYR